ncbi:hypothetical protein F5Y15DRAFT_291413 [Xylariaceae sp. FL0016]|nr:hypothetical protein F5Y15DRAFT_291413 [Xylariaceae sp. FL0016]
MSVLAVPDAGLQLDSSARSADFLPMQAFGITLDDSVIEDMIKCVQKGQDIELTLGNNPSFHYGSREEKVTVTPESLGYDLYLTNLDDSSPKIERLPNETMSILKKPPAFPSGQSKRNDRLERGGKTASRASSSGVDSDGDGGSGYAARSSHSTTKLVNGISRNNKRGGQGKLLPTGRSMATVLSSTNNRSLPPSPSLNGVASPNPAYSASQQVLEKNKEQRTVLVHELAAKDQPFDYLQQVWKGAESDLKPTVMKVADFLDTSKKWSLNKRFWKELDVWNYDYNSPEDRQSAIDNAIKQYDKQRVGTMDPVWERLHPREDRGKGIVLSKLQATLAKGNITPAPRISAQKLEDGNKSDMDSSKGKAEAMVRSSSQPISMKSKKANERDVQPKRPLPNNLKKSTAKKPTSKVKAAEEKAGKRVLSEEFVYDTSSEDEAPLSQTTSTAAKPKPTVEKPTEKPSLKVAEKPKESPAPLPATRPKPKPVVRAPRPAPKAPATNSTSQKRPREDDDSSSSSGAPLIKRIKPKEPPKALPNPKTVKHRTSDASQNSRGTASSSFSVKSKNTSPTKSSPLASSPPTNASEIDEPSQPRHRPQNHSYQHPAQHQRNTERGRERERERDRGHVNGVSNGNLTSTSTSSSGSSVMMSKKRKERDIVSESQHSTPGITNKKARVSKDVLIQARKFTRFYERYEALHYEITALKEPPEDKLADLLDMRERLVNMKVEISRAVASGV